MRDFHPELTASLASGCTTLCRCVRLARTDGMVLGFTDHDAVLVFDGTTYTPSDGFDASEESAALGPTNGEWDLRAALSDERITQGDLLAGHYDGAQVEVFLADWRNTDVFQPMSSGTLGEVTSRDGVFHAEVRGPFAAYDRKRGRVFSARCDAELGDARCTIDLTNPAYRLETSIQSIAQPNVILLDAGEHYEEAHFAGGFLRRGADTPLRVRAHRIQDGRAQLELWQSPVRPFVVGDTILVTAGCDKSYATCRAKFTNGINFRGFPYMPGDDFALSYPSRRDGQLNGRSLRQ